MSETLVLIVGAGPTGLMTASLLARWGIEVRIIDDRDGPSQFSKATGVQARSLEVFDQLGLADRAVELGLPASVVNLFNDDGKIARVPFGDIGKGVSPYPYLLILPQDQTEQILGADGATHGANVERNTSLQHFEQKPGGVTAVLRRDGVDESVEVGWLIGADGARSTVRRGLGIAFQGDTFEHRFFVADLRIEGRPVEGELNIFVSNRFKFVAMFPMRGTRNFRLVGIVPDHYDGPDDIRFEDLETYLHEALGDVMTLSEVRWFAAYRVHHLVAEHFRVDRAFLVGDAAHVHSPVGGQGMNTGLQDAYNLAWKLALVIREHASPSLLHTYHDERHPNAVKLVKTTDAIFSGFISSTTGWSAFVRRRLLPALVPTLTRRAAVRRRMFDLISQTALSYRTSPLSRDRLHGKVRAGDRMPWFDLDGSSVYRHLSPTRFTLVAVGGVGTPSELEGLASALVRLVRVPRAGHGLKVGFYLIRPDGYIATTSRSAAGVSSYIRETLGSSHHEPGSAPPSPTPGDASRSHI